MSYSTANIPVLENIHTFSVHLESFFNKLKMVKSGWKNYIKATFLLSKVSFSLSSRRSGKKLSYTKKLCNAYNSPYNLFVPFY